MDNKSIYKKISTKFWFLLATLPITYSLLVTLAYLLGWNNDTYSYITFGSNFEYITNYLADMIPGFIKNMYADLLDMLSIDNISIVNFLSWFVWVYFIELLVDFITWLPKLFHKILNKFGGD